MALLAAISFGSVVGVSEGTQKDGRADLFDSWRLSASCLPRGLTMVLDLFLLQLIFQPFLLLARDPSHLFII